MTVAVTGARGYLGGWVVHLLRRMGKDVMELSGRTDEGWLSCVSVADAVIHLAWYSSAGDTFARLHTDCLDRTCRLLQIVGPRGIPVVFTSTASVYGEQKDSYPRPERALEKPNCAYTRSKLIAEKAVAEMTDGRGVVLRLGSLMGVGKTRTKTDLVVNSFAQDAYWDEHFRVWNPEAYKPIIHVRDAAKIVVASILPKMGMCGVYNAASQCPRALEIAEIVHLQTGARMEIVGSPEGAARSCVVDCRRVREALPGIRYREIPEAVREFDGRVPELSDRNEPWG